ncbi:MAG: DUF59 domain-containing protein [Candidatus Thorarchaeota archaeon]|nr:DUF59 domain-containing protein [Candidatus Thorarchaeota archaeon]
MTSASEVFQALAPVMDPEHPVSVTDPRMGIVKQEFISVDEGRITVQFKPTVPYCPMGGLIGVLIRHHLEKVYPGTKISVRVVPGTHARETDVNDMINDDGKYAQIIKQMKERGMI